MWLLACAPSADLGHEYTEPTPILDEDGAVVAAGWARHPIFGFDRDLVRDDLRHELREWDFYAVYADDFAVNFTLARVARAETAPWVLGSVVVQDYAEDAAFGPSFFQLDGAYDPDPAPGADYAVAFPNGALSYTGDRILSFEAGEDHGEVRLAPARESMALVTPFGPGEFFYEDKALGMPASGEITVEGRTYAVDGLAAMDFVRAVTPGTIEWTWATAMGTSDGRSIAVNLGSVFGDETNGTPNAIFVDGALHKLARVDWAIPPDPAETWSFRGDRLSLDLRGTHVERQQTDLGTYHASLSKLYGRFSGTLTLDDGATLDVDLLGGAEHVTMTW